MKSQTLTILLIFGCLCIYAQNNPSKYNTNIQNATKVEIKDGVISIKKADTVIITVIAEKSYKISIDSVSQVRDSTGFYITYIHFNTNGKFNFEYELDFLFDKPASEVKIKCMECALMNRGGHSSNMQRFLFTGSGSSSKGFFAIIKSKEPIRANIKGADVVLPPK